VIIFKPRAASTRKGQERLPAGCKLYTVELASSQSDAAVIGRRIERGGRQDSGPKLESDCLRGMRPDLRRPEPLPRAHSLPHW